MNKQFSSTPKHLTVVFASLCFWLTGIQLVFSPARFGVTRSEDRPLPSGITQMTTVLYDGALNTGTPTTQGFIYLPLPLSGNKATQTFTESLTVLDTTAQASDYAGYFAKSGLYRPLDRREGFTLQFRTQVVTETHLNNDRAGFSVLVVSSDTLGIELGFWNDEVWAQEGGTSQPFTHAEGAKFDTTTGLIDYALTVFSSTYTLTANSTFVLSGSLRNYAVAPPPPLPLNPYTTPNLIFLGDDTSGAKAQIKLAYVAVESQLPFVIYLPVIIKS